MTSNYDDIYSRFMLRIEDYKLAELGEKLAREMMNGYLKSVLSKPMVRRLFLQISADDDFGEIEYELREPLDDDSDRDFVEEMLSLGMIEAWTAPKYQSTLLTAQFFSNSEQRFYSQSQHLSEMKAMYVKAQTDLRKLIRDRAYNMAIINGVES